MKELKVKEVHTTPNFMPDLEVYAFQLESGDSSEKIDEYIDKKYGKKREMGISKDEFHSILDKASQPIEKPKSDSGQSWTSGFRLCGGYNGMNTRWCRIGDIED